MKYLNWEYLFQGKNTYEIWGIFRSLLNKFRKQFMPMKQIMNNKKVKPKWMNVEIKRLIRGTKIFYHIKKKIQTNYDVTVTFWST